MENYEFGGKGIQVLTILILISLHPISSHKLL